jgi:hypothetical protein
LFHQYFAIFFMKMLANIFSKCSNIFQEKINILFFLPSSTSGPATARRFIGAAPARGGDCSSAQHWRAGPGRSAAAARGGAGGAHGSRPAVIHGSAR